MRDDHLFLVSVTWNGSTITGPVLIYLDEILVDSHNTTEIGDPNRPGALICRSEDRARVSWHFTRGSIVGGSTFKQIRTGAEVTPSLSRLSGNRENAEATAVDFNGVWHCRLNAFGVRDDHEDSGYEEQINVGIFSRGDGMLSYL